MYIHNTNNAYIVHLYSVVRIFNVLKATIKYN